MSDAFYKKYGAGEVTREQMRAWSQRPGKMDNKGNPIYTTEQSHKDECDVNRIIRKYDQTGLIAHVAKIEAKYGDATVLQYKDAIDLVVNAQKMFEELPSEIRKRFRNSIEDFIEFFEHEENREEAEKLGLVHKYWTEETDGIGEHVQMGENIQTDNVDPQPAEV